MKTIKSKDNPIYKSVSRLKKKKYRDEAGLYLIEGYKPLADAVASGIKINLIIVKEGTSFENEFDGAQVCMLDSRLFDGISETETSQGIVAVAEQSMYPADMLSEFICKSEDNVVVLDRLQDPGNVGTIIRTAEAAGYGAVLVMAGTADVYSSKVVRAAAGSLFRMPVFYAGNNAEAICALKNADLTITATDISSETDYNDVELTKKIALVIGNEGQGVSEAFLKASDIKIRIPMAGAIESLNAAVAAGILMYQLRKKTK